MSVNITVDWVYPRASVSSQIAEFTETYTKHWARFAGNSMRYKNSEWPAARNTANRGPYSKQESVGKFSGVVDDSGGVRVAVLRNKAKNRRGLPYAYYVNRGVNSQGRVSSARYRANYDACYRTVKKNENRISRFAERAAERELGNAA